VSSSGSRLQLDFLSHDSYSSNFAAFSQFCEHNLNALFVNGAQPILAHSQTNPSSLTLEPEAPILQIRQETPWRFVIRMGDMVALLRALASNLTDSCHKKHSNDELKKGVGF
jgi:hypothetical protein